jgi:uncharacterized protein
MTNDQKRKVLYHANCIDGFTAAWCAWKSYGDAAEYVPVQYNEAPPDVAGADVLIVDFSYPRETLLRMHGEARSLRVLDHHKTAEADLAGLDFCMFDMNRSGAGLAWDELCNGRPRPLLVSYVEDRDLWRFVLPDSKPINAWIGSWEFDMVTWDAVVSRLLGGGEAILRKDNRYVHSMAKEARFCELGRQIVPVVNAPYLNTSELVGHLAEGGVPFAAGWFQRADGKYQYSLRSCGDFDVSALAKTFGGGGHKNAAGFTVSELVHK